MRTPKRREPYISKATGDQMGFNLYAGKDELVPGVKAKATKDARLRIETVKPPEETEEQKEARRQRKAQINADIAEVRAIPATEKRASVYFKSFVRDAKTSADLDFEMFGGLDDKIIDIDLRGANLRDSDCSNSDWTQSGLSPLKNTLIEGANFTGAIGLAKENFVEAFADETTILPEGINLKSVLRQSRALKKPALHMTMRRVNDYHDLVFGIAATAIDRATNAIKLGMSEPEVIAIVNEHLKLQVQQHFEFNKHKTPSEPTFFPTRVLIGDKRTRRPISGRNYNPDPDSVVLDYETLAIQVNLQLNGLNASLTSTFHADSGNKYGVIHQGPNFSYQASREFFRAVIDEMRADMPVSALWKRANHFALENGCASLSEHASIGMSMQGAKSDRRRLITKYNQTALGDLRVISLCVPLRFKYESPTYRESTMLGFRQDGVLFDIYKI